MGNWEGEEFIRPVILGRIGHSDPDTDSLLSTQIQVRIRTKKNRAEEGGLEKRVDVDGDEQEELLEVLMSSARTSTLSLCSTRLFAAPNLHVT
jgi:hypothetical protein